MNHIIDGSDDMIFFPGEIKTFDILQKHDIRDEPSDRRRCLIEFFDSVDEILGRFVNFILIINIGDFFFLLV